MSDSRVAPTWTAPARLMGESRLARLAARGDARAFEVIFERHHQELYRYCRAILTDPDDAQDALQATMTAAMRALPGEQREIELRPWLFRVAHNESISIARPRRELPTKEPATTAPGADVSAEGRERIRHLVSDLSTLPERQRAALVMRELSGLSYYEIASSLDSSGAAARQVVYEAREAMRETGGARDTDCAEIRELMSQSRRPHPARSACSQPSARLPRLPRLPGCDLATQRRPPDAGAAASRDGGDRAAGGDRRRERQVRARGGLGRGWRRRLGRGSRGAGGASAAVKAGAVVAALAVGAAGGVTAARRPSRRRARRPPARERSGRPNAGAETEGGSGAASNGRARRLPRVSGANGNAHDERPARQRTGERARPSQPGPHGRRARRVRVCRPAAPTESPARRSRPTATARPPPRGPGRATPAVTRRPRAGCRLRRRDPRAARSIRMRAPAVLRIMRTARETRTTEASGGIRRDTP